MINQKKRDEAVAIVEVRLKRKKRKKGEWLYQKKCKEKVKEIREDKNTDETNEEIEEKSLVSPKIFKNIAFDVRKEIQDQLEGEGKVDSIGTDKLKKRIRNLLKQVLGITKISDDLIDEVMFLPESESDKKSESEQEKKDSSSDSKKSVHNSDVKDGKSHDIVHYSDAKESEPEVEEFDENKDIMLFMDDDNIKNIKHMQDSERLQVFDKVNILTKFPGYQPKQKESLLEIVIKLVVLMRLLKQNKKLVDSEVEEAEDLIKDIRAERIQQKWIKESTGKTGSTDPEKEDKVVDES